MKIATSYNNFARGQADHDLIGRYDIPLYGAIVEEMKNFFADFKGNAIYRTGFKRWDEFQDCVFYEYAFNRQQNYLLLFYNQKIRFLTFDSGNNFGWVLSGGSPLEVATPYSLAECADLSFAKNGDTIYIAHRNHEPRKLVRTSASTFTLSTYTREKDPFKDTSTTSNTIGTGAKTFTVSSLMHYAKDQTVTFDAGGGNTMTGTVTSYTSTTLVVNITSVAGSGTFTSWTILLGYPKLVCFYGARLFFASTPSRIKTLFGSVAGEFDNFTIPATVKAGDALRLTLADISEELDWMIGGENSLIAGARDGIVAINGGGAGEVITASNVEATLTSADGTSEVIPVRKEGNLLYVSKSGRNVNFFNYDILTESFNAPDANIYSYDITKGGLKQLRTKKDRHDLIYCRRSDGAIVTLAFQKQENIIGWHRQVLGGNGVNLSLATITDNFGKPFLFALNKYGSKFYIEYQSEHTEFSKRISFNTGNKLADDEAFYRKIADEFMACCYVDAGRSYSNLRSETITYDPIAATVTSSGAVFNSGHVGRHIVYKTSTGYEKGRFEITGYVSSTVVNVEVLTQPSANVHASWYLTFTTLSGLNEFQGQEIAFVTDGGFYDSVVVPVSNSVTFAKEVCSVSFGYAYEGLIKTFPLGFLAQGSNTQVTQKSVSSIYVKTVNSAGGEVGTDPYKMQPIQRQRPTDLNYLPPLPMNGTTQIDLTDSVDRDKSVYIRQGVPAPLIVNNLVVKASYVA